MVDINRGVKKGARILSKEEIARRKAKARKPKKTLRQTIKDRHKRIMDI